MAHSIFNGATFLTGSVAAVLWFLSARTRVYPGSLFGGLSVQQTNQINRQSNLNAAAAALTGVTALLQAIASLCS